MEHAPHRETQPSGRTTPERSQAPSKAGSEREHLVALLRAASSREELCLAVAAADASRLFRYGQIADVIGVAWGEVPALVLEAPAPNTESSLWSAATTP